MENKNTMPRGPRPGPGLGLDPGPRMMQGGKAKDFKGTWRKLLRYCRKYWMAMVIAIIAAIAGTSLTLQGPDKLSELTKVITDGMVAGIDLEAVAKIGLSVA